MNSLGLIKDKYPLVYSQIPSCTGYFDFPASMIAFGESLKNSTLWYYKGAFFRKTNNVLTLKTYFCNGEALNTLLHELKEYKIKSLNFVNKDFTNLHVIKSHLEFFVNKDFDWDFSWATSKHRSDTKRRFRKGESEFRISTALPNKIELNSVFDAWLTGAKLRHFMVVKGHYLRYLQMVDWLYGLGRSPA